MKYLPYSLSGSAAGNIVNNTLYNNLGGITEINLGNGLKTTFGYYGVGGAYDTTGGYYGRLWEIKTLPQAGGTALQDSRHTWDAGGNLYQRQDVLTSETESFTYDFLDRLLSAASGNYSESYSYNEIGNIMSRNGVAYTYGAKPHAVTSVGSNMTYSYDANGNMLTRIDQTLTWDAENRLIAVSQNGTVTYFFYDGDGNRVKKIVDDGQIVTTAIYVNKYFEVTSNETTSYYYLGNSLIAQKKGSVLSYVHADHLSGTSVMSDASGSPLGTIKYSPFGLTRSLSGTLPTDKLFTGQRLDSTGLYYYGARYYDATIGRFLSPDTVSARPANPQSLNRYSYVLNNPLKYNDPTGHWPDWGAIWNGVCDFASGVGDAFVETGKAVVQMVVNPVDTFKSIGNAIAHPIDTLKAIAASYSEKAGSVRGWGQIVGEALITVGTFAVGGGAAVAGAKVVEKVSGIFSKIENFIETKIPVIGKMEHLNAPGAIGANEYKVADLLTDMGSPKLNWKQNSGVLRGIMNQGQSIKDISFYPLNNTGFLAAERYLLSYHGWYHNNGFWLPPIK